MKQFLITASAFTGQAKIIYDDGVLTTVDISDTNMNEHQRRWLLNHVPIWEQKRDAPFAVGSDISDFANSLSKDAQIVESDIEINLEDFKREYPYARNSHLLPPIWDKMSKGDQVRAFFGARQYRKYCDKNQKWYKPRIAAAWLKDKEYLNDWKTL